MWYLTWILSSASLAMIILHSLHWRRWPESPSGSSPKLAMWRRMCVCRLPGDSIYEWR